MPGSVTAEGAAINGYERHSIPKSGVKVVKQKNTNKKNKRRTHDGWNNGNRTVDDRHLTDGGGVVFATCVGPLTREGTR